MLTGGDRPAAHMIKARSRLAWIYTRQQILSAVFVPHSATESKVLYTNDDEDALENVLLDCVYCNLCNAKKYHYHSLP